MNFKKTMTTITASAFSLFPSVSKASELDKSIKNVEINVTENENMIGFSEQQIKESQIIANYLSFEEKDGIGVFTFSNVDQLGKELKNIGSSVTVNEIHSAVVEINTKLAQENGNGKTTELLVKSKNLIQYGTETAPARVGRGWSSWVVGTGYWYGCNLLSRCTCVSKLKLYLNTYQLTVNFTPIALFTCLAIFNSTRTVYPTFILFILIVLNIFSFELLMNHKYDNSKKKVIPTTVYFIISSILYRISYFWIINK
ncbi:hypothetical protein D0U04_14955 [Bacillus clarus]|uniref:Uncharacterized protein n=1 Tax=Bacillus clarus TaxID=2338372 RepID=A0A090YWF6_9BACI|nr:hypothetical protein [Bacillus clarus]KFN02612.1 hypothetical protein DJ93_3500 [Bacillus clarus]RFT66278.1 hypothetical protein D0U04_14955 [Bacillus clarus]